MVLKNIKKKYKNQVVFEDLNLNIETPGVYGIIGLSGSGKTTLLNILYGLDTNYTGDYYLFNKKIQEHNLINMYNDEISIVFQDMKLLDNLTVYDNLKIAYKYNNDIDLLLTKFGIIDLKYVEVKYLSGGEKQRLAITRALINDPKIILLDEPTVALDDRNTKFILDTIKQLASDKIVVVISHDERIIDHIDTIYELSDQNITLINSYKQSTTKVVDSSGSSKNNNSLIKIAHKNIIATKKTLIPTSLALLISLIIFTLIALNLLPALITEISKLVENGETTQINYILDNNESYEEIPISAYNELSNLVGEENITPANNIIESIGLYGNIKPTVINDNFLTLFSIEKGSEEYNDLINVPINYNVYANSINESFGSYDATTLVGEEPDELGEIVVPTYFVAAYFNTTDYNSVIGSELTLTTTYNKGTIEYLNIEEQQSDMYSNENVDETITKSYQLTITGVYSQTPESGAYQSYFNDMYEMYKIDPTTQLNASIQVYTYFPPFWELSESKQTEVVELYNFIYPSEQLSASEVETGFSGLEIVIPYNKVTSEEELIKIANALNTDITNLHVQNKSYEYLRKALSFYAFIFIVGAIFLTIAFTALNLINLKARKDEFAKYYLIGFTNSKIIKLLVVEFCYISLLIVPLSIIISTIIFKTSQPYTTITNFLSVILCVVLLISIIISFLIVWYSFTNRSSKILRNLREGK